MQAVCPILRDIAHYPGVTFLADHAENATQEEGYRRIDEAAGSPIGLEEPDGDISHQDNAATDQ